jgi:hypothetical protein
MSLTTSENPISPALAQLRADDEKRARKKAEAKARAQRWAMSLSLRGGIIKVALGLCGLETTGDGQVQRIEEEPPPKPREKLAAMRVLATYDKLSIEEHKLELREKAAGRDRDRREIEIDASEISPEVANEVLGLLLAAPPPPPPPKPKFKPKPENQAELDMAASVLDARWPLSIEVRGAVIETAANLCGLAITDEGTVAAIPVTDETPSPKPRIKLGALRVLARFDRLSLEHRRLELVAWRSKQRQRPEPVRPNIDPELAAKINALVAEDVRKHREPGYVPTELESDPAGWRERHANDRWKPPDRASA